MDKKKASHGRITGDFLTTAMIALSLLESMSVAAFEWERPGKNGPWLLLGYSFNTHTKVRDEDEQVAIAAVYPTWALSGISVGRWFTDMNLETILGSRVNGDKGVLVGVGPNFRMGYRISRGFFPYLDLSVGLSHNDMDLHGMGTRFNFSEQVGGGLETRIWKSLYLRGEYRFIHLSNAGLSDQNAGLSLHSVLAGFSYSF